MSLLQKVGAAIQPDETLLVCRRGENGKRIVPGAISYYASAGRPFYRPRTSDQIVQLHRDGVIRPPYRVVCGKSQFEDISQPMTGVNVIGTENDFVHWTASGLGAEE